MKCKFCSLEMIEMQTLIYCLLIDWRGGGGGYPSARGYVIHHTQQFNFVQRYIITRLKHLVCIVFSNYTYTYIRDKLHTKGGTTKYLYIYFCREQNYKFTDSHDFGRLRGIL